MGLEKGKEKVVAGGGKGKRKWRDGKGDEDKTGRRNRKNPGVLQFFEDEAYQVEDDEDSSDESFFDDDDFAEEELSSDKVHSGTGKATQLPFVPKEEELSEEELERMVEERYRSRSGLVTYAEDCYDRKSSIDRDIFLPSAKGQIWKLKCTMGRERYSTLCLMQKFAEMENLGRKLLIISACALDNVKGYIFIEADKQNDVYEACKGLSTIYSTRMTIVPSNEISRLLLVKSKSCGISVGMWARVKNGRYKGDLAKVAAVNVTRRKVTVKLVPRIDVKAMAEKFGGGVTARRNAVPPQRLISPIELEDFRPLIQIRKDRDTNETFEFLDGMMLKDGYVYKKIPMDSLTFWGITPSDDELAKFEPGKKVESANLEWISQLLGKKKEVEAVKKDKGGGKSEGSSSFSIGNDFEVEDLVFIGRKDFGIVIGMEKDNSIKIMKAGSGGPSIDAVKRNELKIASFDKKLFSVSDQHLNLLTVNDSVRILEGSLKDRQGIVKKIYKGVLFLFDEAEEKNNGYLCVKANICEKIKLSDADSTEQGGDRDPSIFADPSSSPKTPLSPDQSFQDRDNKNSFSRHDDAVFSVGQSLRIRIGPLKGYLCRVLAIRRSDVTVKLDSMHKILTVKCDHLSEVRGRNSAIGQGEEQGSFKPFSFLGSQDGASDWMDGVKLQTEDNGWNARQPTERTSWSAFPSSNFSLSKESGSGNSGDGDAKKAADSEDSSWQKKATADQDSSWDSTAVNRKIPDDGPSNGWGAPGQGISGDALLNDSWGKADASKSNTSWGRCGISSGEQTGNPTNAGADSDKPEKHSWENAAAVVDKLTEGTSQDNDVASESKWNRPNSDATGCGSSWGKQKFESSCERAGDEVFGTKNESGSSWSKHEKGSGWNKSDGGSFLKNQSSSFKVVENSSWGQQLDINAEDKGKGWNVPTDGSVSHDGRSGTWNRPNSDAASCGSSWGKQEFKSSCENAGGAPSGTKKDGGSSWSKHEEGSAWNKTDGGSSWKNESSTCEPTEKSSWGEKPNTNAEDKDKGWKMPNDGNASGGGWGKGGASGTSETDSKKNSWSSGSNWNSGNNDRGSENQEDDTYNNGGRGGSWNGGRGDRDSFRGRGRFGRQGFRGRGSERGGFGGRGGFDGDGSLGSDSQDDTYNNSGRGGRWNGGQGGRGDRGGFRGRGGSDQGGFGGRGSEGGGFRGRGGRDSDGFRGRGRGRVGNWRNDGDDSNVDNKSYSWGQGSNNDVGGWKGTSSGGSWNQGSSDNNPPKSWTSSQTKWGSSNAGNAQKESGTSGWGSSNAGNAQKESGTSGWGSSDVGDAGKDSGTGGWGSSNAGDARKVGGTGDWGSSNTGDARKEVGAGSWGSSNAGDARKESATGAWGSSNAGDARKESATGAWGSSNTGDARKESATGAWGSSNAGDARKESATGAWGSSNAGEAGQSKESNKDKEPSDAWGTASARSREEQSSDGWQASRSNKEEGPSDDAWGKAAKSSWGSGSGNDKGGW